MHVGHYLSQLLCSKVFLCKLNATQQDIRYTQAFLLPLAGYTFHALKKAHKQEAKNFHPLKKQRNKGKCHRPASVPSFPKFSIFKWMGLRLGNDIFPCFFAFLRGRV